jgi:hypothetical protein
MHFTYEDEIGTATNKSTYLLGAFALIQPLYQTEPQPQTTEFVPRMQPYFVYFDPNREGGA